MNRKVGQASRLAFGIGEGQPGRTALPCAGSWPLCGTLASLRLPMNLKMLLLIFNNLYISRFMGATRVKSSGCSHFGSRTCREPTKAGIPNDFGQQLAGFGVPPLGGWGQTENCWGPVAAAPPLVRRSQPTLPERGCVLWTNRNGVPATPSLGIRKVAVQRRPGCGWSKGHSRARVALEVPG